MLNVLLITGGIFCTICAIGWYRAPPVLKGVIRALISLLFARCCGKKILEAKQVGNTLCIPFKFQDVERRVFVAFDAADTFKYTDVRIMATKGEQPPLEITQMPGIPYQVTAKDLGYDSLKIYSADGTCREVNDSSYVVLS